MLVLSRQRDQSVMIGEDTEVRVVDVRGDKVRLGFIAPRDVAVHRKEVFDAIRRENRSASQVTPEDLAGVVPPPPAAPPMRLVPGTATPDDAAADHAPFLRAAVEEARAGLAEGGLPIGSVLVRGGQVVARGHDHRVQRGDPLAHAEIDCLTRAGPQGAYADAVLYSTLAPCFLCGGAVVQLGIPRVVVGDGATPRPGARTAGGTSTEFLRAHGVEVLDLADPECARLIAEFVRDNPDVWNEGKGR